MKPFTQSLVALWKQLGLNQRISLVVAALAVIGSVAALVIWSRQPDYQLLYGRLADKDAASIISALQAQGVPYRASAGGGSVYVPANQVHRLRMDLAAKGLPGGEGVGFEIFDKGQFGLSDFVQRTNYTRALQGELARTISQLDGVARARVMIVQPENRLLLIDQGVKPTASVFVELTGPRLDTEAVNSIRNLVANAVQGLKPAQVAVVDQKGRVLSSELQDDPTLADASSQMRYRQQVEEYFAKKVESLLLPVVGAGNAVVRVSAEIDTEAATRVEERYDPDGQVVRTQTSTEDVTNSSEARSGGVVGVTANATTPPPADQARPTVTNDQTRKNRTLSYEINRTLTNTTRSPGTILGLTAAVFIAPRPPAAGGAAPGPRTEAEIAALRQVVVNALGLRPSPGRRIEELVTLQEVPFQAAGVDDRIEQIRTETRVQGWIEAASRYVAVAVAVLIFFIFWRMLKRQHPAPVPVEFLDQPPSGDGTAGQPGAAATGLGGAASRPVLTPEMLNELIKQKPANVGAALRDWMATRKT
ncbi:flagellar basal-body MS-ring/collar protein FliF [Geminisphaera colitermitum]|uniref:flagellar basal-body MS-ring/collar protein FliF n=1 Tax=Geminisphaera colitermitum TaxID=1148786 RepID=UPI000158D099|nr:flagellar basal-body MS-ring/collar protein FliF [Geminisphaera colitermitum]